MVGDAHNSSPSPSGERPSLTQFILSILPFRSAGDLLVDLAKFWRQFTGARTVVVLDSSGKSDGLAGFDSVAKKSGHLVCVNPRYAGRSPEDIWTELRQAFPEQTDVGANSRSFPLTLDSRPIGMVVTSELPESADMASENQFRELVQLTARLVVHAAELEEAKSSASRLVSRDEFNPGKDWFNQAKLEALAEFAAGAGHEINNPVATIAGRAQLLLAGEEDPERRQALLTIGGQAHRIRDMIGDVMLFARPPEPVCANEDLSRIAEEVVRNFEADCAARGCRISCTAPEPTPVWGDAVHLAVAIGCLVQNALDVASAGGRIGVSAESVSREGQTYARLSVKDNGPGLTAEDREHLFDPFYSGRQAGRGLGFGLSKCWRIVTKHRGRIDVTSGFGETRFDVWIPATAPAPDPTKEL